VPLAFSAGSANGSEECVSITTAADQFVECEENFVVHLMLMNPVHEGTCLSIGNNETILTITDDDGTLLIVLLVILLVSIPHC
jgi:hypothetical protein